MSNAPLILLLCMLTELQIYCRDWRLSLLTQPNWRRFRGLICYFLWRERSYTPLLVASDSSEYKSPQSSIAGAFSTGNVQGGEAGHQLLQQLRCVCEITYDDVSLELEFVYWLQWGRGGIQAQLPAAGGDPVLPVNQGMSPCSPGTQSAVMLAAHHPQLRTGLPCGTECRHSGSSFPLHFRHSENPQLRVFLDLVNSNFWFYTLLSFPPWEGGGWA